MNQISGGTVGRPHKFCGSGLSTTVSTLYPFSAPRTRLYNVLRRDSLLYKSLTYLLTHLEYTHVPGVVGNYMY